MAWNTRQLAELAGTTLRTVRHYHGIGLLAEPERGADGHTRQPGPATPGTRDSPDPVSPWTTTTSPGTLTPAAMVRMDSPRRPRARTAARLSSSTTRHPAAAWRVFV